ncbi:MAG: hypothetical protein OEZ01_05795 [Candidatus Heimdallarchaeota archaeon]|nr:hypothetical protein [Candidatus Heimdallarchaeota archaeon]MDH5645498.1 hypothetical protein [Candidatus Heimdallarchaeota archaeon]
MHGNSTPKRGFPGQLSIAKVVAPLKYKRNIVRAVEQLGEVEPIEVDPRTGVDEMEIEDRRVKMESYRSKFQSYLSQLDKEKFSDEKYFVGTSEKDVLTYLEGVIDLKGKKLDALLAEKDEINTRKNELESLIKLLEQFETLDIKDTSIISDSSLTKTYLGVILKGQLDRLLWFMEEVTDQKYFVIERDHSKEDKIVLLSVLRKDEDPVADRLKLLNFQEINIPKDVDLDGLSKTDCINELTNLNSRLNQIMDNIDNIASENGAELSAGYEICEIELKRVDIEKKMRRTATTCVMWAWIAEDKIERFKTEIHAATEGSADIDLRKGDFDPENAPSHVKNSKFMGPMRGLVTSFGTPSTHEVDPYPFVKYLFPIMFGIMFADVGHGFIVFLIGLFAYKKKQKMLEIPSGLKGYVFGGAELLIIMGLTAMVLGVPFNSFFGDETILWRVGLFKTIFADTTWKFFFFTDDPHHIERNYLNFLIFSFIVGAGVIMTGLGLNLYQLFNHRHSNAELYAAITLTGTYSSIIFAALSFKIPILMNIFVFLAVFCALATLVIEYKAHKIDGLMLGVDHLLSLMSNTFSFGRLLAMNTVHFVLAYLPYLFLDKAYPGLLNHDTTAWIDSSLIGIWIIAALLGALIVVPVETTFSTLQALRLCWVEFYGKFFKGLGVEFKPVTITRINSIEQE